MSVPSIKGTAFHSAHEDVCRLLAAGRLARPALEARLEPGDVCILDTAVGPAAWYPIACYARLVELLVHAEGAGRERDYLLGRGARAAERLSASGIYQQLNVTLDEMGPRIGNVIVTLANVIYNFTRWSFEPGAEPGHFQVRVDEARDFPEVARFTTQGFMEYVAARTVGALVHVASERPAPDRILYRAELGS